MLQQRKGLQQQQQQQHWDPVKKQLLYNEDTSPSKWNRKKKTKYGDVLLVIVKERANKNILLLLLVILFSLYQIMMHTNKSFIRMPISLNHHSHHPTDCGVQLLKKGRNHKRTQPRVFGYYFEDATPTDGRQWKKQPKRLRVYDDERYPSKRRVKPMLDKTRVEYIQNSQHYTNNTQWNKLRPYRNHPECQPMYDWQESTTATIISNCNTMHEQHVLDFDQLRNVQSRQGRLINGGYFRNVWRIKDVDGTSSLIMKTLQLYLNYTEWIYERHRIDARIMERMTSSPHIMDIYGYCGQASIVEYGPDGDIEDWLWKNPDRASRPNLLERLRIAVQITQAITDLHTYDSRNGYSAMVHADVMTNQFIYTKSGRFKLNDFNRAHFMYWNTTSDKNTTCPYIYPDYNAWTYRSPEEYQYSEQTEKIDVYSMGNLLFTVLTELYPFEKLEKDEGEQAVIGQILNATKPTIPQDILDSDNPIHKTFVKAITMCWEFDWRKRPSAKTVRDYLQISLRKIESKFQTDKNNYYDLSKQRFQPLP